MWRWVLRALLAVILLLLLVHRIYHKAPVGFSVGIVKNECRNLPDFFATRPIRLRIKDDGTMFLNSDPVDPRQLRTLLSLIFKTRNQPILFLDAGELVRYQDIINALGVAKDVAPNLKVLIISPSARKECDGFFGQMIPAG